MSHISASLGGPEILHEKSDKWVSKTPAQASKQALGIYNVSFVVWKWPRFGITLMDGNPQ